MKPFTDEDLDRLMDQIIEGLSLEERVLIARMEEAAADLLQRVSDTYIRSKNCDDPEGDHPV